MRKFIDIFSSLKLTLALMLGLALLCIGGTLKAGPDGRFELYYQSIWFRAIFVVFFVNLATCTWKTVQRNLGDCERLSKLFIDREGASTEDSAVLAADDLAAVQESLKKSRYRIDESDDRIIARSGRLGRWGSTIAHCSCLLIILGAFAAELGFVGTLNIRVGDASSVCYDWDLKTDRELGFTFRLEHFEPIYYPIDLKFGEVNMAEQKVLHEYTATEGETVQLSSPGMSAKILKFSPEDEHLILGISRNGEYLGEYHIFSGAAKLDNRVDPGADLRLLGWRDPLLKQLHSEVAIYEDTRLVKKGVISVNHPLVHRGVAIYQTAHARDENGLWVGGFQFSRDPGEGAVWVGSITFVLGLLCAFFVPYRVLGVRRHEGRLILEPLRGFRGEFAQAHLEKLVNKVNAC